jgi:hypothetical protein
MKRPLAVLPLSVLAAAAGAQTYTFPYSCTQQLTMTPPINSRWDYIAANQFTHCHDWYFGASNGYTVNPPHQNPGFHTHGIDQRWAGGWYSFCIQPCAQAAIPLVMRTTYVDPSTGTGPNGLRLTSSLPSVARAEALSRIDVPAWNHGQPVTARVHASGFRQLMPAGFWSRSFALSEVEAKAYVPGRPPSGLGGVVIFWSPLHASLINPISHRLYPWTPPTPQSRTFRLYDPIEIEVTGPDGTTARETLLDMHFDLLDAGEVSLEEGDVSWDAPGADFELRWGAFGSSAGFMTLSVRDGVVQKAESSDIDLALLPPVGTPVPFRFTIPSLALAMPLDRLFGYPYTAVISSSDAGLSAPVSETPACPADWNLDGFLDFFDYDEFVRCFETADCGWRGSADFNEDGFADFFDYDAFVEAFENGC